MTDEDGFRIEAALQFGFQTTNDDADEYACTESQLLAFAKACERAGMYQTFDMPASKVAERIAAIDAEIGPIRDVELAPVLGAERIKPVPPCDHKSTFSFGCNPGVVRCDKCGKLFGTLNIDSELLA